MSIAGVFSLFELHALLCTFIYKLRFLVLSSLYVFDSEWSMEVGGF